jgi:precorrin-6B methylase 2
MTESFMPPELSERHRNFKTRFVNNLDNARPGWYQDHKDRGMNIGCIAFGAGVELKPLSELFPNARLVGIETDQEAITIAQERSRVMGFDIKLKRADATESDAYVIDDERLSADFILARSPRLANSADISMWDEIIEQASDHLTEEGILFVGADRLLDADKLIVIMQKHLDNAESFRDPLVNKRYSAFNDAYYLVGEKPEK